MQRIIHVRATFARQYSHNELVPGNRTQNSEKDILLKAVVVIPTYNEKDNIEKLVHQILAQNTCLHIIIVDDNSPDGTGGLADILASENDRINVLHRKTKLGLGSAYRDGFRLALDKGADYIIEMDADFSHDPLILAAFLEHIREFDMVVGSRYLHGVSVVNWPIRRLMLSYFANFYTRLVTGLQISDCTSGFKCFRREVIEAIDLDNIKSDGYSFQIEMKYRCIEKGFKIIELPIIFIDRHAGSSKMSRKIVREAILMVWKLRLGSLLRKFSKTGEADAKRKLGITM
jgi:dolichol-phosphate mannosyltransferase